MLSDDVRKNIKKLLCSMEGNPEQIAAYFRSLSENPEREETMSYAWEVIRKCFDEEAIMGMENAGLSPVSGPDEDNDPDEGDDGFRDGYDPDSDGEEGDQDPDEGDGEDGSSEKDDSGNENAGNEDDEDNGDSSGKDDGDTEDDKDNPEDSGGDTEGASGKDKDKEASFQKEDQDVNRPSKKEAAPDMLAGVELPPAIKEAVPPPEPTPPVMPVTPLGGMQKAVVEDGPQGRVLRMPSGDGSLPPGPVYVIPADTGKEVELRIMELRVSTDENLRLAYKIHEEIARSVAEEHKIRESMYSLVQAYGQLAEKLTKHSQQSAEIQQRLAEGTARAERFMNDDMSRLFRQRATEATNSFYEEAKDRFNELFKSAVRRYKQFTEAAMDFQDKMSGENERRVRAIESKLGMVEKIMYVLVVFAILQLGLIVVFKVL